MTAWVTVTATLKGVSKAGVAKLSKSIGFGGGE
jgi:hypothetical protein